MPGTPRRCVLALSRLRLQWVRIKQESIMAHTISFTSHNFGWRVSVDGKPVLDTLLRSDAIRKVIQLVNSLDGEVTIRFT
jgi:hypothetical protein